MCPQRKGARRSGYLTRFSVNDLGWKLPKGCPGQPERHLGGSGHPSVRPSTSHEVAQALAPESRGRGDRGTRAAQEPVRQGRQVESTPGANAIALKAIAPETMARWLHSGIYFYQGIRRRYVTFRAYRAMAVLADEDTRRSSPAGGAAARAAPVAPPTAAGVSRPPPTTADSPARPRRRRACPRTRRLYGFLATAP